MVRYTVVWLPDAENELTSLWCDQTNRRAISEAADRIDLELAVDPQQKKAKRYLKSYERFLFHRLQLASVLTRVIAR